MEAYLFCLKLYGFCLKEGNASLKRCFSDGINVINRQNRYLSWMLEYVVKPSVEKNHWQEAQDGVKDLYGPPPKKDDKEAITDEQRYRAFTLGQVKQILPAPAPAIGQEQQGGTSPSATMSA